MQAVLSFDHVQYYNVDDEDIPDNTYEQFY